MQDRSSQPYEAFTWWGGISGNAHSLSGRCGSIAWWCCWLVAGWLATWHGVLITTCLKKDKGYIAAVDCRFVYENYSSFSVVCLFSCLPFFLLLHQDLHQTSRKVANEELYQSFFVVFYVSLYCANINISCACVWADTTDFTKGDWNPCCGDVIPFTQIYHTIPVMCIAVNRRCEEGSLWEMALDLLAAGDWVVGWYYLNSIYLRTKSLLTDILNWWGLDMFRQQTGQAFTIIHHHLSSSIISHHQPSSSIVHHPSSIIDHQPSAIIIIIIIIVHFHPSSSIIIHYPPSSIITITHHLGLSSTIINL